MPLPWELGRQPHLQMNCCLKMEQQTQGSCPLELWGWLLAVLKARVRNEVLVKNEVLLVT